MILLTIHFSKNEKSQKKKKKKPGLLKCWKHFWPYTVSLLLQIINVSGGWIKNG